MFDPVMRGLASLQCSQGGRFILEKPFGHDLASARALNQMLCRHFPESSIYRIDHYLGKEPVQNLLYFLLLDEDGDGETRRADDPALRRALLRPTLGVVEDL
jgi:glucose-6-phosphate 1-dehydrogenase